MTIDELCEGLPKGALRTRIVNALHAEGVDTVDDLDAFLDANGFFVHGRLYRFPRLRWIVPNLGMRSWKAIRQALQEKAPHVLDEAK